jgi:anti-anti-sigma regulatory factor
MPTDFSSPHACPHAEDERPNFTLRMGGNDPERVIFFLSGDLLEPSCPAFEHFTRSCIDGGTRRLRLDLTDLHSLDLDGARTLLAVHEYLSAGGGRLLITNVSVEVLSTLRLFARPLLATETSVVFSQRVTRSGERGSRRRLAG